MGFIVMVLSAIIGIFLIALGFSHIKTKKCRFLNTTIILIGIILVCFAIWLGLPK